MLDQIVFADFLAQCQFCIFSRKSPQPCKVYRGFSECNQSIVDIILYFVSPSMSDSLIKAQFKSPMGFYIFRLDFLFVNFLTSMVSLSLFQYVAYNEGRWVIPLVLPPPQSTTFILSNSHVLQILIISFLLFIIHSDIRNIENQYRGMGGGCHQGVRCGGILSGLTRFMLVFDLSRTDQKKFLKKKYSYPPPFSLEKNKSAFLGCFSKKSLKWMS